MYDSFRWNAVTVGYFFCALGSLVIPINLFVGYISKRISDRKILVISQSMAIVGSFLMIRYAINLPMAQYLVGIITLFLAC